MRRINRIKSMLNTQTGKGISWNMVSLVFLALSGLVFQVLIIGLYDPVVMAYFNVAFGWYVAFSQVSVAGVHFSVLKYVSEYAGDQSTCSKIISSALLTVFASSISVIGILYLILGWMMTKFDGMTLQTLYLSIPALFFFSINKVLLNYYNALSKMKVYAVFQSLRNIFLMFAFILIASLRMEGIYLIYCFLLSEGALFLVVVAYTIVKRSFQVQCRWRWIKEHLRFGIHIMPSNIVLELNYRVDVLSMDMLGIDKALIGIYSFAAHFAEGFYQLFIVIRRNINPLITQYYTQNKMDQLDMLRDKVRKYTRISVPFASAALIGVYIAVCYLVRRPEGLMAVGPLIILLTSMSVNSYHTCFGNMLNQVGLPRHESWLNIVTLGSNILLNIVLIRVMGIYGAATATAVSYFVFSSTLYYFTRTKANYRLKLFK